MEPKGVIRMNDAPRRYQIVEGTVVSHPPYGLFARLSTGQPASVDADMIADMPLPIEKWPPAGSNLRAAVLGTSTNGVIRLCSRPSYIRFIEASSNPARVTDLWASILRADELYVSALDDLLRSGDSLAILRWELATPRLSPHAEAALRVLAVAPREFRLEFVDELVALSVEGDHGVTASTILGSIGLKALIPILQRSVDSLIHELTTVTQYQRLIDLLHGLGASKLLDQVLETVRTADDPRLRSLATDAAVRSKAVKND